MKASAVPLPGKVAAPVYLDRAGGWIDRAARDAALRRLAELLKARGATNLAEAVEVELRRSARHRGPPQGPVAEAARAVLVAGAPVPGVRQVRTILGAGR